MDYINLSTAMSMLDLVRYLLQDTNNSFSFYNGHLSVYKEQPYNNKHFISTCQYICQKAREHWNVNNIGIIASEYGELSICVTSQDPSLPAEVVNFVVEAVSVCTSNMKESIKLSKPTDVESDESMDEDIPSELIQVNATMKEINQRIGKFIEYKTSQTNINNVIDFCGPPSHSHLCARVDAVLVRKKDSFSHMAVRNVLDRYITKGTPGIPSSNISSLSEEMPAVQPSTMNHKVEAPAKFSSKSGKRVQGHQIGFAQLPDEQLAQQHQFCCSLSP